MRDYSKVAPQFWTGDTGKKLKSKGPEAVIVALYLMTCPHANMIGLYYLPTLYIAHETGLGMEGASKGLARAVEAGFCTYDEASEHVFVHAMARFQVADSLKSTDNRVKGVDNELARVPKGPLTQAFIGIYGGVFHLEIDPLEEAPCKPLGSQEQEQEQEQEQKEMEAIASLPAGAEPPPVVELPTPPTTPDCPHGDIVALYHKHLPANPKIKVWDGARQEALRTRWREDPKRQNLEYWDRFMRHVAASPFLTGRIEGTNGRPFLPGLEWLAKASNFAKIIEGRYHDRQAA